MTWQRGLKYPIGINGVGLHNGREVSLTVHPAPPDTGVVFRRVDLPSPVDIPATVENVVDTTRSTILGLGDVRVGTVEHLLAALASFGIDNAVIEVDNEELPIMDGSSSVFVLMVKSAGIEIQKSRKNFIRIKREISASDGDKSAVLSPYEGFSMEFSIDFGSNVEGVVTQAQVSFSTNAFVQEICRARTFGFRHEVESLRAQGLALGGSLDNAVIINEGKVYNDEGLRSGNELVMHKVLDAIGDLSLLGCGLIGRFSAHKPGHALNNRLLRKLLAEEDAWEKIRFDSEEETPIHYDYFPTEIN